MADIAFVALALAFFGLCVLYVAGCERLIGREPAASEPGVSAESSEATAR